VQPVRADLADPNAVLVVNAAGEVEPQFMLVRGRGGTDYLHDGLNASRRIGNTPSLIARVRSNDEIGV